MAHLSQATELTETSPATRPLPPVTDDSLTKVGQRDLQVASKITAENKSCIPPLNTRGCCGEGVHPSRRTAEGRTLGEHEKGE